MSWSLFGSGAAEDVVALPSSASQAQEDTTDQPRAPLNDKEKWQRSKERWNLAIKPTDEVFNRRYEYFVKELETRSPEAVVKNEFSNHEVRKFLNGYVDKSRFRAIHAQQAADTDLYRALLRSVDYEGVEARTSPLPLKLTMMYFGLPVAPMAFTDPLQSSGDSLFGNWIFSSGLSQDEDNFDDDDLSFVPEELRPLRFLNYYDRRGHGRDNTHSQSLHSSRPVSSLS